MIRLRAAFLVVLLSCFSWASNTAHAGPNSNYNDWTWNNDIDYYADTYLEANPDAVMTDWHWMLAGDPNNGDTTDDGFCFMFYNAGEPYAIYNAIDPSQCAFYNNATYANTTWISFMDANMISEPGGMEYIAGEVYTTEDLLGNTSQYWSGCYNVVQSGASWGGTTGGQCPNINDGSDGQINFGYIEQTLTNIAAINTALQGAGLETTGYTYSWQVKNADANRESENNPGTVDPFYVTLEIRDVNNTIVYSKTFDYSYHIDNWVTFSGEEEFVNPYDLDKLSAIELSITGQDIGNWAGYYGPEFRNPDVRLKYRVKEDTTVADILFEQMCLTDPLYDINCPGYNDAILNQMNEFVEVYDPIDPSGGAMDANLYDPTGVNDLTGVPDLGIGDPVFDVVDNFADPTDLTGIDDPAFEDIAPLDNDPIAGDPVAAADPTATTDPTSASVETETAATQEESAGGGEKKGGGLSANQQFALNQAEAATSASEQTASQQSESSEQAASEANSDATGFSADGQPAAAGGVDMAGNVASDFGSMEQNSDTFEAMVSDIVTTLVAQLDVPEVEVEVQEEMSAEEQNAQEDALVAAAESGDDSEDAKAALLGYNPNFRAYQTQQMADASFYDPKEIYEEQKNYDNPDARFFNGASDAKHRDMVRQQYER